MATTTIGYVDPLTMLLTTTAPTGRPVVIINFTSSISLNNLTNLVSYLSNTNQMYVSIEAMSVANQISQPDTSNVSVLQLQITA